jgi:hypothetical protein
MMRPPEETCQTACLNTKKVPRRLVAITLSKSCKSPPEIGESSMMPAQFTHRFTPPKVSIVSLKKHSESAVFTTSAYMAMACPPADDFGYYFFRFVGIVGIV